HQANHGVPRNSQNYIPPVGYPPLAPSYAALYAPFQGQQPAGPVVRGVAATAADYQARANAHQAQVAVNDAQVAAHQAQAAAHQAQANQNQANADRM
ncbi:MAG: hypothetical protein Q9183_007699, partial [Haloplaca sp. 2 TL-2023]